MTLKDPEEVATRSNDHMTEDPTSSDAPSQIQSQMSQDIDSYSHNDNIKPELPYSILTRTDKAMLIVVLSFIGFWSSISSPIYFPVLPILSKSFHVTEEVMNLSVVAYLIFQGLAPTFSSNIADTFGRRPVYMISFLIFIASCIGLSQTNVYWLLAVLRCVQAAGIAPVIAINSGVAGDVCLAHERGGFVGIVSGMLLVGNGFGSLIGSAILTGFNSDWRAIFIFLAIGGGGTLIFLVLVLPETNRLIVGNGSIKPSNPFCVAPLITLPHFKKKLTNDFETLVEKEPLDILSPFKILIKVPVICTLLPAGMQFASWTMTLTSISTVLEAKDGGYNYGIMHVGLIYLPQGIACLVGSLLAGKVLNGYYRYRKNAYDERNKDIEPLHRPPFNKFRVRLDICVVPSVLMIIGLIIFGWCLEYKRHIVSIIISTCLISFSASSFMAAATTMLVDFYPTKGSTSTSCMNLVRCLLAAVGVAVLSKMSKHLGLGGTYTLMAGFCLLGNLLLVWIVILYSKKLNDEHINKIKEVLEQKQHLDSE